MKVTVAGLLAIWLILCVQVSAQPSPSPTPTPSSTSKEDLEKSVENFSRELKETKQEAATALEDSKKSKPKPKPSPSPTVARRKKPKPEKKPHPVVVVAPKTAETNGDTPASSITTRPLIPLKKTENRTNKSPKATEPGVKKKKTFWQKLWHILPFRFFGEH